jgi:protein phosphatase 2C family protein 2/3
VWELGHEDEFLILGCDGLWDVMTSKMVVDIARKRLQQHNDPEQCSQDLVDEALRRHSSDNVTVVTVCFQRDPPPRLTTAAPTGVRRSISVDSLRALQGTLDTL